MTFFWILLALASGQGLRYLPLRPEALAKTLNTYVLWICLPALTLAMGVKLPLNWSILLPASVAWFGFIVAVGWVSVTSKWFHFDRATTGCLLLTAGLGNTSFVGFPLIRWLYGEDSLWIALLIDQPGSFLVLSTLGLMAGAYYAEGQELPFAQQARAILRRIVCFPPFVCFALALLLNVQGWQWPMAVASGLSAIAATLTPAALLAVGLQLQLKQLTAFKGPLVVGLGYRLGIAPLLVWALYGGVLGLTGNQLGVSVLEAGMAPMITGSIVAAGLGLNPALASVMVSVGIACSLVTVPLWFWVLQMLGT
jgi:malate permease and related proteins